MVKFKDDSKTQIRIPNSTKIMSYAKTKDIVQRNQSKSKQENIQMNRQLMKLEIEQSTQTMEQ